MVCITWRDLLGAWIVQKPHTENSHQSPGVFQPSNSCLLTSLFPGCLVCIWRRFLHFTWLRRSQFPNPAIGNFAEVRTLSLTKKRTAWSLSQPNCVEHIGTISFTLRNFLQFFAEMDGWLKKELYIWFHERESIYFIRGPITAFTCSKYLQTAVNVCLKWSFTKIITFHIHISMYRYNHATFITGRKTPGFLWSAYLLINK